jgi:ATP-dependent Clp protease protease subunit
MNGKNMNPLWYEKTRDGEMMTDVFARLVKDRIIFLVGEITQESASTIVAMMFLLNNQSKEKEINLWIYSEGGDVSGFFAIYDTMQLIEAPIRTVCFGSASSAAAMILAAGSKGKRHCLPNSHVMIHQIQVGFNGGTGTELEIEAKEAKKIKNRLTQNLARHTGQLESKVRHDCEYDKYLDAESALEYGIIDSIMAPSKEIPELKTRSKKAVDD